MANPNNPNTGNKNANQGGQGQGQGMPRREQDDQDRTAQRNPGQPSQRDVEGEIPGNRNSELGDRNQDVTERRPHREQK
jgi:hypothetical protein